MRLTGDEQDMLGGGQGPAVAFATDILVRFGDAIGASHLIPIVGAHIDGCLHHGAVSLDFVERLVADAGRVRVPTSLNVGSMDLLHPDLIGGPASQRDAGRRLMQAHLDLGCAPSFTCAPYQTMFRPRFGDQIAWGESNAIVFANSVIGARTNRYGDFLDLCCAIAGRAPAFGLHLDEHRRGDVLFRLDLPDGAEASDTLYVAAGYLIGELSGGRVPVLAGLPPPRTEDLLKALGATAASSGAVGLFHAVGITPEAPTLRDALGGRDDAAETIVLTGSDLREALSRLSTAPDGAPLTAVSLGTPHFSLAEFERLAPLLAGFRPAPGVEVYVNTGRDTYAALDGLGLKAVLDAAGLVVLTDTCTYVTALLRRMSGVVMTNSGKWAHYAPGNLGVDVAFGSLEECIVSAAEGRVSRMGP